MKARFIYMAILALLAIQCAQVPRGKAGQQADDMVKRMQKAAEYQKWLTETAAVSFEFAGKHKIFWDKKRGLIEVAWSDYLVQFEKKSFRGFARDEGKEVTDPEEKKELIQDAFSYFINDTFWLNPVFHLDAQGATRQFIEPDKLLITYSSGGVTPGDSYLFEVDNLNRIKSMRMWVSIIPFKGVTASFSDYKVTETGVPIATRHKTLWFVSIDLDDLKMYRAYPQGDDRFGDLLKLL